MFADMFADLFADLFADVVSDTSTGCKATHLKIDGLVRRCADFDTAAVSISPRILPLEPWAACHAEVSLARDLEASVDRR